MKKTISALVILAALITACGNGSEPTAASTKDSVTTAAAPDLSSNPDYQTGLELVAGSDCFTCHKVEDKLTGPSYREVANKYAGADTAVAYLAKRIITGGGGVWGEAVMTPHPSVSQQDAEAMAKYVLLLKK